MSLKTKIKVALDETRLLILGAQVLFGFQLHGVFQESFPDLAISTRYLASVGQFLMALALALLIAPSMQHRVVEDGEDTVWILTITTLFAGMALLPFGISLVWVPISFSIICSASQRRWLRERYFVC
jgi:hypothetical protein